MSGDARIAWSSANLSRAEEAKGAAMSLDGDDTIHGVPRPYFFQAIVNGESYGFDLEDIALTYTYRKLCGMEPIFVNPITLKEFHPKTRARMIQQLESLVESSLLPRKLSLAWRD